uniref:Uncharacterized protein n=2 Tax=Aegilops tauschii subsp. strangulata TaxID=200361 RepID=A0A453SHK9_AEGTS
MIIWKSAGFLKRSKSLEHKEQRSNSVQYCTFFPLMIGALVAAQAAVQRSSSSMGKRAAANEQQYGQTSSSKRTTVWAEELHRRQGRSRRTGTRAGEKEQQALAQEIEEHAREIKEEACELLVHLIVEAGSGNAREELRPGGNAAAHARGSRRMRVSSKRMRGSSKRTHASSRRTCREVPTTPAGNRGGRGSRLRRSGWRRRSRYLATAAAAEVEQVRGDGGGALPAVRRIAQLGGAGPWRRRRKKTGAEGVVSDRFETRRFFL